MSAEASAIHSFSFGSSIFHVFELLGNDLLLREPPFQTRFFIAESNWILLDNTVLKEISLDRRTFFLKTATALKANLEDSLQKSLF